MKDELGSVYNVTAVNESVADQTGIRQLVVEDLAELPEWNQVLIFDVCEAESQYGRYLVVTYIDEGNLWRHQQTYFRLGDLKRLLVVFGILELSKRSQLLGKKLFVSFSRREGRGKSAGRVYVEVRGHSLNKPGGGDDIKNVLGKGSLEGGRSGGVGAGVVDGLDDDDLPF